MNFNFSHTEISITTFKYGYPIIFFYEMKNGQKTVIHDMPLDKALVLMWKLKKQGGKKVNEYNRLSPGIFTRKVTLWDFDL